MKLTFRYTGIGPRKGVPEEVVNYVQQIGTALTELGYTLLSGGADGMDTYFENTSKEGQKEIYLPYKNFNKNKSPLFHVDEAAIALGRKFHPIGDSLTYSQSLFMGRNCYQVLGLKLDNPTDFLITWKENLNIGGTSQAIRVAKAHNVPIFNLYGRTPLEIEMLINRLRYAIQLDSKEALAKIY